jgi:transglutaminase-like putative cysteine protease
VNTFHIDCELDYDVQQQTLFVFNLGAATMPNQRIVAEMVAATPDLPIDEFCDESGRNRFHRVDVPPGRFSLRYLATVEVQPPEIDFLANELPLAQLPGETLSYLGSSRYCEVEAIYRFAVRRFGNLPAGYQRVQAICRWVKENVDYLVGSSTLTSGARDILATREGVCRDFAHLGITLCRSLNIPARFVTAYAQYADPPPDFHAIFEAYLGDRWYLFDATGLAPISDLIRIGTGRDASDVPFATFFGTTRMRRLSPLIVPATGGNGLARLQTATSGIVLSDDNSSGRGE